MVFLSIGFHQWLKLEKERLIGIDHEMQVCLTPLESRNSLICSH